MSPDAPGARGWGGLVVLALTWGSAFALIGVAVETLPPALVAFGRLAIGAAILIAWALMRGRAFPPLTDRRWLWFMALGLTGNALPFFLIAVGQQTVPSGLAGILIGAMPMVTISIAHLVIPSEKLTFIKALGFSIGFAGVVILMGPAALEDLGGPYFLAQLIIFGAGVSYAINAVLAQIMPETPPSVAGAGMLIGAVIWSAPFGLWALVTMEAAPSAESVWALIVLGVFPTALASIVYMAIARKVGAAFIAQTNYYVPVVAALLGVALGEALGVNAFIALGIILLGMAVARRKRI
ncbi:EamA family transporter [Glycocaulis profundi]|nr:EamA family transporter [Glycocaulis profundi]